jgi:hypothetical protein
MPKGKNHDENEEKGRYDQAVKQLPRLLSDGQRPLLIAPRVVFDHGNLVDQKRREHKN